jgi:uncharacterized protein
LREARRGRGIVDGVAVDDESAEARAARLFVAAARVADAEPDRGRELLAEAARAGSSHAALELGLMMIAGRGGDVDSEGGVAWVGRAAEAGLPTAAALLGGALLMRADAAADGVKWLRKAAAANEPSAFWLLATAYQRGIGVARDAAQARLMMHTAAQLGVVEAQLELAQMYACGVGGARDDAAAGAWELRAAEAGSALGCVRVAERALAQPGGVARALPWLERATAGGNADAAARLAALYRDGRELPRDESRAGVWQARADELRRRGDG